MTRTSASGPVRDADACPFIEIPADGDTAGERARWRGSSSLSAAWCRVRDRVQRIQDSPAGDAIACASLFVTTFILLIIAGALE